MQQRLSGPAEAHVQRIAGLHDRRGHRSEVLRQAQRWRACNPAGASPGRAHRQRVHQQVVADPTAIGQGTRANGASGCASWNRLSRCQPRGAGTARVCSGVTAARRTSGESALREDLQRTGEVHVALLHHHLHARVRVRWCEHRRTHSRACRRVLLAHAHRRQRRAVVRSSSDRRRRRLTRAWRGIGRQRIGISQNRPFASRMSSQVAPVGIAHECPAA